MNTTTVLEIIKMIDARMQLLEEDEHMHQEEYYGAMKELRALNTHLQSFVDGQLNTAENQTEQ